jgi:hypothetical protein
LLEQERDAILNVGFTKPENIKIILTLRDEIGILQDKNSISEKALSNSKVIILFFLLLACFKLINFFDNGNCRRSVKA